MGPSDGNFDAVLERAIFELLSVPVVEGEVALEPHGTVYAFAEPRLQEMSAAQKQLLRMGPQNVRTVQGKLREIAAYARHSGIETAAGEALGRAHRDNIDFATNSTFAGRSARRRMYHGNHCAP